MVTVRTFHCNYCNHEWESRYGGTPKYCPKCHNPNGKKPKHNSRRFE